MRAEVIEQIIAAHSPRISREVRISKREYAQRWARVQGAMRKKGYDIGYACGSELDRSEVAWPAGYF